MVSTWELKKTEVTAREILGSGRLELRGTTLGLLGDYWVKDIWPWRGVIAAVNFTLGYAYKYKAISNIHAGI